MCGKRPNLTWNKLRHIIYIEQYVVENLARIVLKHTKPPISHRKKHTTPKPAFNRHDESKCEEEHPWPRHCYCCILVGYLKFYLCIWIIPTLTIKCVYSAIQQQPDRVCTIFLRDMFQKILIFHWHAWIDLINCIHFCNLTWFCCIPIVRIFSAFDSEYRIAKMNSSRKIRNHNSSRYHILIFCNFFISFVRANDM